MNTTAIPKRYHYLLLITLAIIVLGIITLYQEGSPDPQTEDPHIVWPVLDSIQPEQAMGGDLVSLVGHGGYLLIADGETSGYNEGYRTFEIYFDDNAVGEIGCYTNRCQGEFNLPDEAAEGVHQITVEGGSALEIEIVNR